MWRHFDKHYLDSRRVAIAACILIFRKVPLQRLIAKGKRVRHGRCLSFTSPPETPLSHPKHPHSQRTWTISFTQSSSWKSFKLTSSCWCDSFLSFLSFPLVKCYDRDILQLMKSSPHKMDGNWNPKEKKEKKKMIYVVESAKSPSKKQYTTLAVVQLIASLMECAAAISIRTTAITHKHSLNDPVDKHMISTPAPARDRRSIFSKRESNFPELDPGNVSGRSALYSQDF